MKIVWQLSNKDTISIVIYYWEGTYDRFLLQLYFSIQLNENTNDIKRIKTFTSAWRMLLTEYMLS